MTGLSLHTPALYVVTCKIPDALQLVIHVPPFSLLPPPQVFSALSWISKHCIDLVELMVEAKGLSQCALFLVETFIEEFVLRVSESVKWPLDTSSDMASVYAVFRCGHQWHPFQSVPLTKSYPHYPPQVISSLFY